MNTLINIVIQETQIDPRVIYCSASGKPIANMTDESIDDLLASLPECDDDDKVSEILTRTLASARTSPAWTVIKTDSIAKMFQSDLPSVLAYLLARMWEAPKKTARLIQSLEDRNYWAMRKIQTRVELVAHLANHGNAKLEHLGLLLLEIDSKYNLSTLESPSVVSQFPPVLGLGEIDQLIADVDSWGGRLQRQWDAKFKAQTESDRSYYAGNQMTKTAYMQEFIRQTPPSPTRQALIKKESVKKDRLDFLDQLEAELTQHPANGDKPKATMSQPRVPAARFKPAVVGGVILKAGFKFGGAKA